MTWQENESAVQKWPTWASRLTWARNNFNRTAREMESPIEWKLRKFMVLMANLIALNNMIEEEGGEALLSPRQKAQWMEAYQSFRPTRATGRPSVNGHTEP